VFSGCASFRVSASRFCYSYTSVDLSVFVLSGADYWVSSTTGVGFTGVVSGDGILSTLMISDDYCSPSSNCTHDLVLNLDCLVL
jgi:hypothetical protein